jgi:hypothetical protein
LGTRARTAGAVVGLAFGGIAMAATLLLGDPADWTRSLGWLVILLAPPVGAALGPMAVEQGTVPALLAALWATVVSIPIGALLYTLMLGMTNGQRAEDILPSALASAVFGVLILGVPLGLLTFAVASLAIVIVRLVALGRSNLIASYAGSARSRADR